MFGRFAGDWDDEENARTYLLTGPNFGNGSEPMFRREVEARPHEMKHKMWEFMLDTGVDVVYCFELVEQAQCVPDEDGIGGEEFMLIEDMV